jgi:hypothetical protein
MPFSDAELTHVVGCYAPSYWTTKDEYGYYTHESTIRTCWCWENCTDEEEKIDDWSEKYENGEVTGGVMVVYINWEDDATGETNTLFYAMNLGIDADPSVSTTSETYPESWHHSSYYMIVYQSTEKDLLLSQYKRYASGESAEASAYATVISDAITSLTEYTIENIYTTENLMNFKRSPEKIFTSDGLSVFGPTVPMKDSELPTRDYTTSEESETRTDLTTMSDGSSGGGGY